MASHGRKGDAARLLGSETLKMMTLGGDPRARAPRGARRVLRVQRM